MSVPLWRHFILKGYECSFMEARLGWIEIESKIMSTLESHRRKRELFLSFLMIKLPHNDVNLHHPSINCICVTIINSFQR